MNHKSVRKGSYKPLAAPVASERLDSYRLSPRRVLNRGDVFQVSGVRGGKFEFMYAEVMPSGVTQIQCVGGPSGHRLLRTFLPDRITKVVRPRS